MPKTDEGEFELVLGNKQLLSVFFIVVVLLGVFFTMGYIVGRNTAGTAEIAAIPGQPLVVDPGSGGSAPVTSPEPASPAATPAPDRPKPVASEPPERPVETPKPKPAPAKPPVRRPDPPKPAPPARMASGGVSTPASGTSWLQVAATSMPEGQVLRDVLIKRGFSSRLAPVPGQDLIRVLVGPLSGSDDAAQTRSKLQSAGFKPFARRY